MPPWQSLANLFLPVQSMPMGAACQRQSAATTGCYKKDGIGALILPLYPFMAVCKNLFQWRHQKAGIGRVAKNIYQHGVSLFKRLFCAAVTPVFKSEIPIFPDGSPSSIVMSEVSIIVFGDTIVISVKRVLFQHIQMLGLTRL